MPAPPRLTERRGGVRARCAAAPACLSFSHQSPHAANTNAPHTAAQARRPALRVGRSQAVCLKEPSSNKCSSTSILKHTLPRKCRRGSGRRGTKHQTIRPLLPALVLAPTQPHPPGCWGCQPKNLLFFKTGCSQCARAGARESGRKNPQGVGSMAWSGAYAYTQGTRTISTSSAMAACVLFTGLNFFFLARGYDYTKSPQRRRPTRHRNLAV